MDDKKVETLKTECNCSGGCESDSKCCNGQTCEDKCACDCESAEKCACEGGDSCVSEIDKINNLKEELNSWQERYLRTLADCENTKRRVSIDAQNMLDYKITSFAKDILPLADNVGLAISSMEGKVDDVVMAGLKSISEQFIAGLEKNGISKIKTVGEKLNPAEHSVVMQIETSDFEEGVIVQELQVGYKLGDKVIRAAMVATAKTPKN